ncbi:tyrosine-type recombinase/integrase [Mycolicibacterium iranicum]|uniref:Tyrosine-type recombinase/integrase n=1 Tax=Mycolicibacterium iranicum TaxID=912594 RepID=A0ABT4HPY5_MYCIR|nr:tyrosine-type recombinase/integrase [Mycolicibacterium iranicum]MCZ0732312.1 tyrosine-type recombinase/integrase [Mycolicibacterium iranicum]
MTGPKPYPLPPAWETALAGWVVWLKLGGTAPTTVHLRHNHLRAFARQTGITGPAEVTLRDVVTYCSARPWSNDHRKGVRGSLISFFDWCVDNNAAATNPAASLPKVPGARPRPRPATDEIWAELLAASDPRTRMMARLAGEVGMRRAEVAVCQREDLVRDADGWSLIVHGKGGKQRVVPITDNLADELRAFCPRGHLFPSRDQWGNLLAPHVSAHHVGKLISALMPPGWSMHKLRHRYATRGLAGTGNLRAVQEALGHASVATTQIYTAVANRDVRAVAEAAADTTPPPSAAGNVVSLSGRRRNAM